MKNIKYNSLDYIAKDIVGINTLNTVGSDSFDFHELSVTQIRQMLFKAHQQGVEDCLEGVYYDDTVIQYLTGKDQ